MSAVPGLDTAPVRLAVTLGDPRGIGPEVADAAAAALIDEDGAPELLFVGPRAVAGPHSHHLQEVRYDGAGTDDRAAAGRAAAAAIRAAVALAEAGMVDGIVTAPIDKAALNAAGEHFPGHTEMLQALTGARQVVMLMAAETTSLGGPLRVVLATTHLPLAEVPANLSVELLVDRTRITAAALRDLWGIDAPRIGLCALNPHASDDGLFGDEEARILTPAVQALREAGLHVEGPIPADTVFVRALRGAFDAVVAPYHDVGMAAFKTAAFGRGVNVTLGLPFIRTSPDHGTALDIAGTGRADASSMIEAVRLAARLARAMRSTHTTRA